MLRCTVKFCGGCNPRYDRGALYQTVREQTADVCTFSLPEDGVHYDALLIVRGCTGCPYLYEDIDADTRLVCVSAEDATGVIHELQALEKHKRD